MIGLVDNKKTFDKIHFLYFLEILSKLEIGKFLHIVIKIMSLKWTDVIIVLKILTVSLNSTVSIVVTFMCQNSGSTNQ